MTVSDPVCHDEIKSTWIKLITELDYDEQGITKAYVFFFCLLLQTVDICSLASIHSRFPLIAKQLRLMLTDLSPTQIFNTISTLCKRKITGSRENLVNCYNTNSNYINCPAKSSNKWIFTILDLAMEVLLSEGENNCK